MAVDLLAEFEQASVGTPTNRCLTGVAIADMADDDRRAVEAALLRAVARDGITYAGVARVLNARGVTVKAAGLSRHANRECACDRAE